MVNEIDSVQNLKSRRLCHVLHVLGCYCVATTTPINYAPTFLVGLTFKELYRVHEAVLIIAQDMKVSYQSTPFSVYLIIENAAMNLTGGSFHATGC